MSDTTVENTPAVDMERLEALLVDISKAVTAAPEAPVVEDNSAEIIAKGADAIVEQSKQANEQLVKGLEALVAKIEGMEQRFAEFTEAMTAKIEKGLTDIAAEPVLSKSVKVEAEVAPADPAPVAPVLTKQDVLSKALAELPSAQGDRKAALLKGIAMLDTNYAPAEVAAELNLV